MKTMIEQFGISIIYMISALSIGTILYHTLLQISV